MSIDTTHILVGAAGVAVGAVASALSVRSYFKQMYERIANEEIASVKNVYSQRYKTDDYDTPKKAEKKLNSEDRDARYSEAMNDDWGNLSKKMKMLKEKIDNVMTIIKEEGYSEEEENAEEEPTVVNVFDNEEPQMIEVISFDEFFTEDELDRLSLTYYEADDIVTDERDSVVANFEKLIGVDALTRFGENSDSRDIVYIRNTEKGAVYEVTRDLRSYQEVVLGITEDDLKIGRMKDDD